MPLPLHRGASHAAGDDCNAFSGFHHPRQVEGGGRNERLDPVKQPSCEDGRQKFKPSLSIQILTLFAHFGETEPLEKGKYRQINVAPGSIRY